MCLLFFVGGVFYPFFLRGGETDPKALFVEGNEAYQKGDYRGAVDAYEKMTNQGLISPALCYNLGNAYYRLNRPGPARLWFERALRLNPGDEDIRYNLSRLRSKLEEDPPGFVDQILLRFSSVLGGVFVLNVLFFIFLTVSLFRDAEPLWWARWGTGVLLVVLSVGVVLLFPARSRREGVILTPRAEARVGPSSQEQVGFVVPEGRKVELFETINGWTAVGLPEKSLKGWVLRESVRSIQ